MLQHFPSCVTLEQVTEQSDARWILFEANSADGQREPNCSITVSDYVDFTLYACIERGRLKVSWRLDDVFPKAAEVDLDLLAFHLYNGPTFTEKHYIKNIVRILPNVRYRFKRDTFIVERQEPGLISERYPIVRGLDISSSLIEILKEGITSYDGNESLIEYSGGFDSSLIGCAAVLASAKINKSYGLTLIGPAKDQQVSRRLEFISHFGLSDTVVPASVSNPFREGSDPEGLQNHLEAWDELYGAGISACLQKVKNRFGLESPIVFTGIGGDELYLDISLEITKQHGVRSSQLKKLMNESYARKEVVEELDGIIPSSSFLAAASRAHIFFNSNVMPVNLFCNKNIFNWFRHLPLSAARNKTLVRMLLKEQGLSDSYIFPLQKENFSDVFNASFAGFNFVKFFKNSYLAEIGILNPISIDPMSASDDIKLFLLRAVRIEKRLRLMHQ